MISRKIKAFFENVFGFWNFSYKNLNLKVINMLKFLKNGFILYKVLHFFDVRGGGGGRLRTSCGGVLSFLSPGRPPPRKSIGCASEGWFTIKEVFGKINENSFLAKIIKFSRAWREIRIINLLILYFICKWKNLRRFRILLKPSPAIEHILNS